MRVGVIDCGTNSIRLLVADVDAAAPGRPARVRDVGERGMQIVRLGQGVDRTGRFDPSALARTLTALREYAARLAGSGVDRVRMVATSATRDAANRDEFLDGVRDILGIDAEVIDGETEAALSFAGAVAGFAGEAEPFLVVDIGGGSTEFVLGTLEGGPSALCSVQMGCVRLAERHLASDPVTEEEVAALLADVDAGVAEAARSVDLRTAATLVGVAGTVTTVAGIVLGLPAYDAERIHGARLTLAEVERVSADLARMTSSERAAIPVMHAGRVDVITAGALVLRQIARAAATGGVLTSEHDILDGMALELAAR